MKINSKLAAGVLIAAFALSGCSSNDEQVSPDPASQEQAPADQSTSNEQENESSEVDTAADEEAIRAAVTQFYTDATNSEPIDFSDPTQQNLMTSLSPEDADVIVNTTDPIAGIDLMSPEGKTTVVEYYRSIDPLANHYSYTGLNEADQSIVSMVSIMTSTMMSADGMEAYIPEVEKVTFTDESHASAVFNAMNALDGGATKAALKFVKEDGAWKIDGSDMVNGYRSSMAAQE